MRPPLARLRPVLLLLACTLPFLYHLASGPPTSGELAEAAQWLDGLDWPDLRGKAYVELTVGRFREGAKTQVGPKLRGFLLSEDERSWTVFCDGTVAGDSSFSPLDGWA